MQNFIIIRNCENFVVQQTHNLFMRIQICMYVSVCMYNIIYRWYTIIRSGWNNIGFVRFHHMERRMHFRDLRKDFSKIYFRLETYKF
jgi:hypothetical protein